MEEPKSVTISVTSLARSIGMIRPPSEIRKIIDKTAEFVSKNGPEFETKIRTEKSGNEHFNFLISSNPYHAYYQHQLSEFRSRNQQPCPAIADSDAPELEEPRPPNPVRNVPESPETEEYTVRKPVGVISTEEELDVIKLTAQFVARNGKSFVGGLMSREIKNSLFNFLQPGHTLFPIFSSLANAYSKVLMPQEGLIEKLKKTTADMAAVIERCENRLEWERLQEQERVKVENEIEQERIQMATIDWFDFVVVETIDFEDEEDEDLPSPVTLEQVIGGGSKMVKDTGISEVDMDMDMDEDTMRIVAEVDMDMDMDMDENTMRIVKNWKRPEERIQAKNGSITEGLVSPITGELISVNEMSEHVRISLIDPKYREQKERMFAKIRETTLAQDDEISRNILSLARTRPDIFGTTEEEVTNAVKAEIEISNFSGPSAPPPTPKPATVPSFRPLPPPPLAPIRPPIVQYQSVWTPLMMLPPSVLPYGMPAPPPTPALSPPSPPPLEEACRRPPLPEEELPEPKRRKSDEYMSNGTVCIAVRVPSGQLLEITLNSLSETVGRLKEKISGEIQVPANKQKLSGKGGRFLKDNTMSLADYNIGAGETLTLSLRDRGGRKR